jgi:hypothetical protein
MTDTQIKYRTLTAACMAIYGPFFGPLMAAWLIGTAH